MDADETSNTAEMARTFATELLGIFGWKKVGSKEQNWDCVKPEHKNEKDKEKKTHTRVAGASGQAILSSTIHAFKGLESPVMILTEMTEIDTAHLRQLAYVGSSRANSDLILTCRNG
jgi:hypothetical protein